MNNLDESKLFIKKSIWSPSLDIFRVDESYDLRKVIINKQTKFDVSMTSPQTFPNFFYQFKRNCETQYWANSIILGIGIALFTLFIISAGTLSNPYWIYLKFLGLIWGFFATGTFFLFLLYPCMIFVPYLIFRSYNKKYLPSLKKVFLTMQQEGYIEKDLSKYPESLQLAFWEHSLHAWNADFNHYLRHSKSWYGLLALKYFFFAYDNLKFPIDDNTKWINWFNQFVGNEYMAERVIYNTFGNKEIY